MITALLLGCGGLACSSDGDGASADPGASGAGGATAGAGAGGLSGKGGNGGKGGSSAGGGAGSAGKAGGAGGAAGKTGAAQGGAGQAGAGGAAQGGAGMSQGGAGTSAGQSQGGAGMAGMNSAGMAGEGGAGQGGASGQGGAGGGVVITEPAEKLLLWLKLDETSGSTAADSSGNGHDATLSDPAGSTSTWGAGILGGSLSLEGKGKLALSSDILGAGAFTFCTWYNTATAPWGSTLISNDHFGVTVGTNVFTVSSDGTHGAQSFPTPLPPATWAHVCVARDAAGLVSFFLDGMPGGGGDSGPPSASASPVTLGNHPFKDLGWAVALDEVRLYEGILTLPEVRYLYLQGKANPTPTTVTAASCERNDVQAAITAAHFHDTVQIPAGSCTWTSTLTVDAPITLQGAGLDKTTIVVGTDFTSTITSHSALALEATFRGLVRLTELTIDGGTGAKDEYNKGMLSVGGSEGPWRVDHVRFHANRTSAVHVSASGGVLDHNTFDLDGYFFGIYGFNGGDSFGDLSWSQPLDLGGPGAYFIEDNVFSELDGKTAYTVASDGWAGQRVVFRHNTLTNALWGNHGTDSSGQLRGARSFEVYDNTLAFTTAGALPYGIDFRSGNGVLFGNTITGLLYGALYTDNYRDWSPFGPWGQCDGTSPFDQNDTMVYDSGTVTGSDGVMPTPGGQIILTDSTRSWAPNQWVGFSIHDTTRGDSSIIQSSTATTLTARWDSTHNPIPLSFVAGDAYVIKRAKVCLDQMGRGAGKLMTRDPGTGNPSVAEWPEQAAEASHVWGNTSNGVATRLQSASPHIVDGTDFINDSCLPGYVPYPYPHPLTGAPPQAQDLHCP